MMEGKCCVILLKTILRVLGKLMHSVDLLKMLRKM